MKPVLIITISLLAVSLSGQAGALSLQSCAAIKDPVERLACYDTLSGRLPADTPKTGDTATGVVESAASRADVIVPDASALTPTVPAVEPAPDAEADFGLTDKQKSKKETLDELQLKWASKKKDGFGKWIITLENGQVWHQTDSRNFNFVNSEQLVVIYRGLLGSFFMGEPERRNGIRVKRVK